MVSESLTFACPVCQTRLTIPSQLAGVVGPCPTCGTRIQAPGLPPAAVLPQEPTPAIPPPQEPTPAIPLPQEARQPRISTIETNVGRTPYQHSRLEPAAPPSRSHPPHGDVRARAHRKSRKCFLRFLILPLLLAILAAVVLILLHLFRKDPVNPNLKPRTTPAVTPAPASPRENPTPAPLDAPVPIPTTPPDPGDVSSSSPAEPPAKRPGIVARDVVEAFCQAKTLEERLPLIETTETAETLAATDLAKPLPFASEIDLLFQEPNKEENLTDFYFRVTFRQLNGTKNVQTLLARKRADSEPKVVVAPFLDLYGGRLADFARKPVNTGATFHAVAFVISSCTNEKVIDKQNKYTLTLLAADTGSEIARAYFGKNSRIGEMLADNMAPDDPSLFKFGEYRPCAVYLTWNPNGGTPYLEALDIKSVNWNP